MARFVTGNTFGTTDTVTAALLNQAVNDAAISTDSVDGSTIEVNSNALRIKDNGVTLAKMATQADQTVLGNVSGGTAVPTAVPIVGDSGVLKNDDALGTSDTQGATQGNIKAYVDANAVFTKSFVSSDQTFPDNRTELSVAHSLGEVPKIIQVFAKMTTSVNGYASGDFVLLNSEIQYGVGACVSYCTSSNIKFYRNEAVNIPRIDGVNGNVALSSSNCSLVLKAFA